MSRSACLARIESDFESETPRGNRSVTTVPFHVAASLAEKFYTGGMDHSEYVEQRNGGFYVAGSRVSLDSIVYSFKAGDSPETIRQNFSSLSLEQVYGAIAFYLAHEQEVDVNIRVGEEEIQRSVTPLSESRPELYARLERGRHEIASQDLTKH